LGRARPGRVPVSFSKGHRRIWVVVVVFFAVVVAGGWAWLLVAD
jgi:hypothetical protein